MVAKDTIQFRRVIFISSIAALGGLLFGYDLGVISGAIVLLKEKFTLGSFGEGWAAASAVTGCILGALMAGTASNRFGRRLILMFAALFFLISAIGSALPQSLMIFAIFRLIGGIGLGLASTIAPPYIAEVAPAEYRGRLVSLYQLAIVIGTVVVHFINLMISYQGDHQWNVDYGWRWMFGSEALPALLFLIFLFFLPESPRWLYQYGQIEKARMLLINNLGISRAEMALKEIQESLDSKSGHLSDFFKGKLRKILVIGVLIAVFQQFSGINMIMNFATVIFQKAGSGLHMALGQTLTIGIVNLLFTVLAIFLVDKVGRKRLLWIGAIGQAICLTTSGYIFKNQLFSGAWVLLPILLYVAFFAATIGPVVWVVISEIFPNRLRGIGMAVVTFFLWSSNYLNIQLYPIMESKIGIGYSFWVYAILNIMCMAFVLIFVPETKGRTLEQIEKNW
jgi:sugar porter (SP) family MFS transporter